MSCDSFDALISTQVQSISNAFLNTCLSYICLHIRTCLLQIDDGSGMKREATVDEVIKIVEELTRIH